jgi:hypothetical protein
MAICNICILMGLAPYADEPQFVPVLVWPEIESHLGEVRGAALVDGQDASSFVVNPSGMLEPMGEQRVVEPFLEITLDPIDCLIAALGVAFVPSSEASVEIGI